MTTVGPLKQLMQAYYCLTLIAEPYFPVSSFCTAEIRHFLKSELNAKAQNQTPRLSSALFSSMNFAALFKLHIIYFVLFRNLILTDEMDIGLPFFNSSSHVGPIGSNLYKFT